jgi:hypothetical protein
MRYYRIVPITEEGYSRITVENTIKSIIGDYGSKVGERERDRQMITVDTEDGKSLKDC